MDNRCVVAGAARVYARANRALLRERARVCARPIGTEHEHLPLNRAEHLVVARTQNARIDNDELASHSETRHRDGNV